MKTIMLVEVYKTVNYAGGIERVLCNFANEFASRGYKMKYVCLDLEKGRPYYPLSEQVDFVNLCYLGEPYCGLKYYSSKILKEIFRSFGGAEMTIGKYKLYDPKKAYFEDEFIKRLKRVLATDRPDIIICADSQSLYLAQSACNDSIPTIAMCHTNPMTLVNNVPERDLKAWKKAKVVQVLRADFINFFKNLGIKNVVEIPNAVTFYPPVQKEDKNNKRIVCVGRIEETAKRQHILIEIFARIAKDFPDWQLDFYGNIGSKSYFNRLKELVNKEKLVDKVNFHEPEKDIISVLRNSDIFVTTSSFEGFGLALAEALACRIPAIGYKSCLGLEQLIYNDINGFLCEDGIDDFANKLALLMGNAELRKQFSEKTYLSIEKYSSNKIWNQWKQLINKYI